MAKRPWVQPSEVKTYTEYPSVKTRDDAKVAVDISRAEQHIIAFTNNNFADCEEIPAEVKTAVILVAEAYGFNACLAARDMKSEQFDDYSYTAADTEPIDIGGLDIASLLEDYTVDKTRSGVTLRMRKL